MKRYVCTVAAGFVLALMGTATASANGLPVPGQEATQDATQVTSFGDQSVGEQTNDADVTQSQGNGNLNLSPAIGLGGDATTTNEQGNDNVAKSDIDQENEVEQSQDSTQKQSLDQNGSSGNCCTNESQSGEQKTYGGDQSVEEQKNDADVTQKQGNGNVNIAPAIAVFGDAETTNEQGNGNVAKSDIDQENEVEQSQDSTQKQHLDQDGGSCCESKGYGKYENGKECGCDGGQSQTGEQKTSFGDQSVGEQKNDADVNQWQGNGNVNVSPAVAIFGDAKTTNKQGNGNYAKSDIDQENEVEQSQDSTQKQYLTQEGGGCCTPKPTHNGCSNSCQPKKEYSREHCGCEASKPGQSGEQKTSFGDQWVGKQKNDADVTQKQGNWNGSFAPAFAFGGHQNSCNSTCTKSVHSLPNGHGGNATTINKQGNGNYANSDIDQENEVEQSQDAYQRQTLVIGRKAVAYW
jgi:hypothetical protein